MNPAVLACHRCPWLYDQFVGMYQTDEEIAARVEAMEGGSWAGQLLKHVVSQQARWDHAMGCGGWGVAAAAEQGLRGLFDAARL